MSRRDYMVVCGDILNEEYMKDPERFHRMSTKGPGISDWIYLVSIYLYNPIKMMTIMISLTVIYLGCMVTAWPWANAYWIAILSLLFAMVTTMFLYVPFVAILIGTPILILTSLASIVGGWFGL